MTDSWSLYNKVDKLRVDDLSVDQVRTIILSIASHRLKDWYACQDGDPHWLPLESLGEFAMDISAVKVAASKMQAVSGDYIRQTQRAPVEPEARRPLFEDPPDDFVTNERLLAKKTPHSERRSAKRFPRAVTFEIKSKDLSFVAKTKDMSMKGISIDRPLPPSIGKTFKARLKLGDHTVRAIFIRISSTKMKFVDADSWDVIRTWMVNW